MNLISQEESIKSLVKEIKQKRDGWRNLKNAYVNYSEYVSEYIDKSMSYTEYVADNLSNTLAGVSTQGDISYSEYLTEKINEYKPRN